MGMAGAPVADAGDAGPRARPRWRVDWIYDAPTDLLVSLCWVPLFVAGHQLSAARGAHADSMLRWAVTSILLVSFAHQPLTLALVYGDRRQFAQRRQLFVWAPPITVAAVVVAVALHLWVIVPIAALWNTIHTLQQRYGLSRIYARRAGYGAAGLDRWVLYSWMGAAVLLVAANPATLGLVQRVSIGDLNASGVRLLSELRPIALVLFVPTALAAVGLAGAIFAQETRMVTGPHGVRPAPVPAPSGLSAGTNANPAKWLYQVSSLALIASLAVDPAAGFIAYVGAHAIEYAIVVYKTAESRYGRVRDNSTLLGRVAWCPAGRLLALAAVSGLALGLTMRVHGEVANAMLYTFGALHFLYDGFIWKLRKPSVAADFAISG
jgi:hypothetical protein